MIITKRRLVSVEEVTAMLDPLARRYRLPKNSYDESSAELMSEFDALKWTSLCSQRAALRQRETETVSTNWEVPSRFLFIYEAKESAPLTSREETKDGQYALAA